MTPLPSPEVLAALVSKVTGTMLGITFLPDSAAAPGSVQRWRTALLPIRGPRPVTVGLSSDERGCAALSAAMFSVSADAVDRSMVDDSLRELVNMTAGLVKSALVLDQALGLPDVCAADELPPTPQPPAGQTVVLRAQGLGLLLWVSEGIHSRNVGG